jgi:hypothetical protein
MNPIDIELLMNLFHGEDLKLKSTHQKLCVPIVLRIYKKMLIGIKFPSLKIHGDLIIDGHHRYLASMLAGIHLDTVPTGKSSATLVTKWSEVMLVSEDWDTEAKIKMLNEIDASFNGIAVELLTELLQ